MSMNFIIVSLHIILTFSLLKKPNIFTLKSDKKRSSTKRKEIVKGDGPKLRFKIVQNFCAGFIFTSEKSKIKLKKKTKNKNLKSDSSRMDELF